MTRISLYTDEPVLARGLAAILCAAEGFQLTGAHYTVADVRQAVQVEEPDVLLMDLTPDVTFASLTEIRRIIRNCKIVLWTHSISTELAFQSMSLGVRGILRKTLGPDLILKCLQKVHVGELWFDKGLTDSFLGAKRISLTKREGQLVTLLSQGLKNKEIASALLISEGTVKVYLSKLFQKLGVKDRFELALFGLKNLTSARGLAEAGNDASWRSELPLASLHSLVMERRPATPVQVPPVRTPPLN